MPFTLISVPQRLSAVSCPPWCSSSCFRALVVIQSNGPFVYRLRMPLFQGGEVGSTPTRAAEMRREAGGAEWKELGFIPTSGLRPSAVAEDWWS
jgi:hypothetical protein